MSKKEITIIIIAIICILVAMGQFFHAVDTQAKGEFIYRCLQKGKQRDRCLYLWECRSNAKC